MSEMKNDPSELYDAEFLKKKEEFYSKIEGLDFSSGKNESSEDEKGFAELIDDFDDGDGLMSKLSSKSKKEKKKKKSKKSKAESFEETPEPEYDIFDLELFETAKEKESRFARKKDKKKKEKKSADKKASEAQVKKAPPKPKEPLKPFVPHTPVEKVEADVYQRDEELYKEQNVDIDELLKNLGIPTAEEIAAEEAQAAAETDTNISSEPEEEDDVKVFGKNDGITDISSVSQDKPLFDEKSDSETEHSFVDEDNDPSSTRYFTLPEKAEEENSLGATRHFNLKSYIKSAGKNINETQKKKNLMQGFRVLKNKTSDETILEAVPTGEGKDSMMDSVRAQEGEGIFEAVEKAKKKKHRFEKIDAKQRLISLKEYQDKLQKRIAKRKTQLIILAVMALVSFVLGILPSFYTQGGALEFMFGSKAVVYGLLNIALLIAGIAVAHKEFYDGIYSIRFLSPDKNVVMVILAIFVLIYDIVMMAFGAYSFGAKPYTLCLIFAMIIRFLSLIFDDMTALGGAKVIAEKGECEGVHIVDNKNDALSLAHGLSEKTVPAIIYSADSRVDEGVREENPPRKNEDRFYSFSCMAVLVLCFVAGIVILIKNKEASSFITTLVSGLCLCLPGINELTGSAFFFSENRRLLHFGGCANDFESLETVGGAKAVVSDARELFSCKVSSFKRVRGASISQSDAAVFAAAALTAGGSMLGESFSDFIEALGIDLPEAENIQYEEKLGFSCWIAERRVLVGNRQMLIEHSIAAPSEAEEKSYAGKKSAMYVVVEGELVATFLVKYSAKKYFKAIASDFNKTGLVLMISSKEPCLDEMRCASRLSLDDAAVKVLSVRSMTLIKSYRENPDKGRKTALICFKNQKAILPLTVAAYNLYNSDKFISNIHILGQAVGFILVLLSVILNIGIVSNPAIIVLLQLLWSVMTFFIVSKAARDFVKFAAGELIKKGGEKK